MIPLVCDSFLVSEFYQQLRFLVLFNSFRVLGSRASVFISLGFRNDSKLLLLNLRPQAQLGAKMLHPQCPEDPHPKPINPKRPNLP